MNKVAPLLATRFKLSFNKVGNCTVFRKDQAEELDGRWVWLIDATDGMNYPLVSKEEVEREVFDRLHLISCFCDEMTGRNWADKVLYIRQQAERIRSDLGSSPITTTTGKARTP